MKIRYAVAGTALVVAGLAPTAASATTNIAATCSVHVSHNTSGDTVWKVAGCVGDSIRAHVFNSATLQSRRGIWVTRIGAQSSAILRSNHGGYDIEKTGSTGGGTFHETY
jgi:hypothetical protein